MCCLWTCGCVTHSVRANTAASPIQCTFALSAARSPSTGIAPWWIQVHTRAKSRPQKHASLFCTVAGGRAGVAASTLTPGPSPPLYFFELRYTASSSLDTEGRTTRMAATKSWWVIDKGAALGPGPPRRRACMAASRTRPARSAPENLSSGACTREPQSSGVRCVNKCAWVWGTGHWV